MNTDTLALLDKYFDLAINAPDGIKRLREMILSLAMQGKLVPQDSNDLPASELLKEIEAEKKRLVQEGSIKEPKPLPPIKPEEVPYQLPESWEWVRLGDIASKIHYGYTASANESIKEPKLLRITDIQDNYVDWKSVPGCVIEKDSIEQYRLSNNDILIARTGGTVGKTYLVRDIDVQAIFASYLIRVVPPKKSDVEYLKYYLESSLYWHQLIAACSGTGQPNVNGVSLSMLKLPLPPLPEQRRIVAKIDELMARVDELERKRDTWNERRIAMHQAAAARLLDAGDAGASRGGRDFIFAHFADLYGTKENVAELRKAILQLAVRGRLVPQVDTDPPASELLKEIEVEKKRLVQEGTIKEPRTLPSIRPEEIPYQLPESWEWVRLGELVTIETGKKDVNEGHENGKYPFFSCALKPLKSNAYSFDCEALILPGNGANVGQVTYYSGKFEAYQRTYVLFNFYLNITLYIQKILEAMFRKSIEGKQYGSAINYIKMGTLTDFLVPLPSFPEQHRIVAKVDELMSLCDQLEKRIVERTAKGSALLEAVAARI